MVFESIVVEVLNKFLGDYVENLNKSQLKLGIWGGDVVLENLVLKQNALEELQIPVQTVFGQLGKLTLKIPWKNLYGASVEATIDKLFLVVNPSAEVKYDAEKEEQIALAAKKAELARIEEVKKLEALKENEMDETFVEKLVTQIIKNVQLKITDIHVRYEDSITNPKAPFSLGFTLHNLSVHTTDENWKQAVIQETVTKVFKILSLEGLALYWNACTFLYTKYKPDVILQKLHDEIATKNTQPESYSYVLGPINATAKLKLNTSPEKDEPKFSIPKVVLTLHMEQLSVSLSKDQYRDMMMLADSMDRMRKGLQFRKYRPHVDRYKGHYKQWWRFAYQCVLEEEVRRIRKNWDWNHMLAHRNLCKEYASAYQAFLINHGKVSSNQQKIIDNAEKVLDVLNLVVIRQRIEMEVERLGKIEEAAKKEKGWFSSWWYGGNSDKESNNQTDILKEFQNAMTPQEKEKLFRAIDYQEQALPLYLPVEYVSVNTHFRLDRLQLTLTDEQPVLAAAVDGVCIECFQRPSADAIRVVIGMHTFTVSGVSQESYQPQMVISKEITDDDNLLSVSFETNPLDKSCDQRVKLKARPLQIIYDAATVIKIVEVFKPPEESSALTILQAAAENKLYDLKEKSALGMQYALHQHTFMDISVNIASSYIVIPDGGVFRGVEQCVVVKLGAITVESAPRAPKLDVARLYREGMDDDDVLKEIAKRSYDKITLGLTDMQVVIAKKGEDWQQAISCMEGTHLHLLQPTNLVIQIHQCLIVDDPRLPKIRVLGELQKIAISISEDRLLTLFEILVGMPLPKSRENTLLKMNLIEIGYLATGHVIVDKYTKSVEFLQAEDLLTPPASESKGSNISLLRYLDPIEKQRRESAKTESKKEEPTIQLTEVEAFFIMKELVVCLNRNEFNPEAGYQLFLEFNLYSLELTVTQKTFELEAMVRLASISLSHHRPEQELLYMIDTPRSLTKKKTPEAGTKYWVTITYCAVDKKCPEFRSVYGCVEQLIQLHFTELKILLHLESLREVLVVVNEYQKRFQDIQDTKDRVVDAGPLNTIMENEELFVTKSKTIIMKPLSSKQVESIQMKVNAKMVNIEIEFATQTRPLALLRVSGAQAGLTMKASYTEMDLNIAAFNVMDLNPDTDHIDILKVVGGDVVNIRIVTFNTELFPNVSEVDMSIDAQLNTMRIVFLNWFISSMLEFLHNFQSAEEAIIEASSQAADAARERATAAYQNATKVRLRIRMAAPLIIVPENSKSKRALMVNLGRISISNHFVDIDVNKDMGKKVTIDELTLELEDMKAACGDIVKDDVVEGKRRRLLEPITIQLLVKRSLSTWYSSVPDLDLSGRINNITISIANNDYQSIMKIVNENLTEGQSKVPPPKSQSALKSNSKQTKKSSQLNRATAKSSQFNIEPVSEPVSVQTKTGTDNKITMKFTLTMDSFVINLSTTSLSKDAITQTMIETDLAQMTLTLLSMKGRIFTDGSMHTSLLLVDCTLDDTRPNRGDKMTRFLERRRDLSTNDMETLGTRSMIDFTYTLRQGDTFIDVRTFSFNLILAMDFMNKLTEFIRVESTGIATQTGADVKLLPSVERSSTNMTIRLYSGEKVVQLLGHNDSIKDYKKKTSSQYEIPVGETTVETVRQAITTINIKIEQPDIFLVASLEQKKCDALVLSMEVRLKVRQSGAQLVADGGISGLKVVVRKLDTCHGGASGPARSLLAPTHVSLAVAQPHDSGMHVDISITEIKITISPYVIALINRVLATMTITEEESTETVSILVYKNLWDIREFKPNAYWFLKVEEAEEAIDLELQNTVVPVKAPIGEICLLSSPSIVVSFEMEIGTDTLPTLAMEASLTAQVKDWSSEMTMESTWTMQVSYYNIKRAVWEPLIEPVERLINSQYVHRPWELCVEMVIRPQEPLAIDNTDEAQNAQQVMQRQANKTITISSAETLEITVTSTSLEVLTNLANAISMNTDVTSSRDKIDDTLENKKETFGAPYVLHNNTGLTAQLFLTEDMDFTVYLSDNQKSNYKEVLLEPGAMVPLQLRQGGLCLKLNEPPPPLKLLVHIVEMDDDLTIPVERADKRYFPLGRGSKKQDSLSTQNSDELRGLPHVAAIEPRGLISDILLHDAALHIYLRSVVQVTNNLAVNVSVYHMTRAGNEVQLLGDVAPGDILRLPLQAVYTPTAEIFFSVEGFTVSASPFVWRELSQEPKITKLLYCDSKNKNTGEKFYMKAVGTMAQVFLENTNRYTFASCCYDIVLKPSVKMQNCLPVPILVSQLGLNRTQLFKPGEMFQLSCLAPNKASMVIMIENYLDKCWVCTKNLPDEQSELSVWSFESHDSPALMTLDLGMHSVDQTGTQLVSLYCPFWMVNKTGFTLCYRKSKKPERDAGYPKNADELGNVIFHPKEYKEPILFSFRAKNFFGKKKAAIRLNFGEWSEKFSLDVPGSSGVITCKLEERTYEVAVTNQLTFNSLTKMVIFTPFFMIINEAPFDIQYQEVHRPGDPWQTVEKNSSAPLWPAIETEEKMLTLRVACTLERSAPFLYTEQHSTCLKLPNNYGGLHVDVALTEGGTYISVQQYHDGHALALIVNYSLYPLTVYEKENINIRIIPSMHQMLYAWDNPAGPQKLIFEGHERKEHEIEIRRDGIGDFMVDDSHHVYWVSFLDGLQRVVLVTEDPILASGAHTVGEAELVDTEMVLSMQGMGLSFVNDQRMQEIVYISISNSGIIWEQCKIGSRRYKKLDVAKLMLFEEAYQRYNTQKIVSGKPINPVVVVDGKIEVNFEEMRQLKPSHRILRRVLEPGLWASYGTSPHQERIHARLHRLQVDQQLPAPPFPVVLAPVPPPRSVATNLSILGAKPFIEVSIVKRIMEHSKVRQYKYFKVLIQEFHVKVDMGLINALMAIFPERVLTEKEALEAFQEDLRPVKQATESLAAMGVAIEQKNFYDNLHLSPLKVHVSFSLGGATTLPTFVGTLLQSIGVTLTDMNDVIFKLSYYERNYEFLSQKDLIDQVQNHYVGQALKQLYVLVLGLDVIGNPYGLVIGLKTGVEDLFYEPFQGAIQGPGEFAEGLFLGVRSLVGHTVGGAAGAMSRITGAMGHGIAALSLDKEYQRHRRDNMNQAPANLQEGLARSGKGLVMSMVHGVSGVVVHPVRGALAGGLVGFMKGSGRGAIGVVIHPIGGVIDFMAGLFASIKRAADLSEEVTKQRPERYLPPETGVRPYSRVKAEGYKMLYELEKGKFVMTDTYKAHVWIIPDKEAVVCTDKRILYVEKNAVFGGWQILWTYLWQELPETPSLVNKGIYIPVPKKKVLGVFNSGSTGKVIFLYDEQLRKYLLSKCTELRAAACEGSG